MNELFTNWLHSGDKGLLRLVLPRETYLFLRAEKRPGFDYLYCQRQYGSDGLRRKDSFQYAGLYCAADGLIYDADYALTIWMARTKRSRPALTKPCAGSCSRTCAP